MKNKINLDNIFVFFFLVLFPFGQIIRIGIIQPVDVIVGLAALWAIVRRFEIPDFVKSFYPFLVLASFSWILSIFIFHQMGVLYGLLYLIRLFAYLYFGIYIWNFVKTKTNNKKLLLDSLLVVSIVSALFGWIQFFTFPDLKPFFVWNWDMHLFRLVGTFLDPTFLGLIIVFGLIISIYRLVDKFNWKYLLITAFLLISLAFTYSRASYLAFITAIFVIIFLNKKLKKLLFLAIGLIVIAFLLPTSRNHSIELFRTFSAIARIENYQTTLKIFSKSPVFGVGYDNMCIAYQKYVGPQSFASHACSGSDSSLLFILTTTGIIGFMAFVFFVFRIRSSVLHSTYYILLCVSFVALLVHSLFSNSMFYPWIMGWMVILLAICGV